MPFLSQPHFLPQASNSDAILIPTPFFISTPMPFLKFCHFFFKYPIYSALIAKLGGRQVSYELDESLNWAVSREELEKKLDDTEGEPAKSIVDEINELRSVLIQPSNMQIFVAGNLKEISSESSAETKNMMEVIAKSLHPPNRNIGDDEKMVGKLITDVSATTVSATNKGESGGKGVVCPNTGKNAVYQANMHLRCWHPITHMCHKGN